MSSERLSGNVGGPDLGSLKLFRLPKFELGFAWLLISVVGLTLYFRDGIISLLEAWGKPEYSHGWIIPAIAGFLILREIRNQGPVAQRGSEIPGLLVVLFGILVGLLGNVTQIPYFITYGLLFSIGGIILLIAGARHGFKFWAAWAYLLFMLPLPTAAYWQVSTELQFLSSKIGVEVIRMMSIPVFLDGNVIDLGAFKLQVAEACSGLRYLFPLASFGFLFAVLYQGPFWHKAILFISSFPITVLMNSFIIGVIGVMVDSYGIEQAEGFLHWFEGWIIFISCMAILFAEAWFLQRLRARPKSVVNVLDLDTSGLIAPMRSILAIDGSNVRVGLALLSLIAGITWTMLPKPVSIVPEHKPLAIFPMEVQGWSGVEFRHGREIEEALGADDYLSVTYTAPNSKQTVQFFSAFYQSTTDGTGIHNPEICIPGGGWEVSRWDRRDIELSDANFGPLRVNRAVIQKNTEKQIVYYWFRMRGKNYASEYDAKLNTILDSMTKQRADGALVRFITPVLPGETEADGDKRLQAFMPNVLSQLPEYIPN